MEKKEKVKLSLKQLVLLKNMPRDSHHEVYSTIDRFRQVIESVERYGGIAAVTNFCVKFTNGVCQSFREETSPSEKGLWFNKI